FEDRRAGRLPRQSARFALGFGIVATLAANVASAEPTWTARMVAAVPAVSFLLAVEVLIRVGKPRAVASATPANGGAEHSAPANEMPQAAALATAEISAVTQPANDLAEP